jgi:hypothetical protein
MSDKNELLETNFDAEQRQVLVNIFNQVKEEAVDEARKGFSEELQKEGVRDDFFESSPTVRLLEEQKVKAKHIRQIWDHQGISPKTGLRYTIDKICQYDDNQRKKVVQWLNENDPTFLKDTQFSTDQPLLIPRVVTQYFREAIEPRQVLTPLLTRIAYSGGTHITFPATSGIGPAADIPEGGEYPERRIEWAGSVTATIGKSGIAVKMTEEMIRYSQWDVMAMHIKKAGEALIRHKEKKVAAMLFANATTDFNNDGGTPTTGRAKDGTANGTFTMDDLLVMYANAVNAGWAPDTLIMHPQGWLIFARDPTLRAYGFENGKGLWQPYQGQPGAPTAWGGGGFINDPRSVDDPSQLATTYTPVPDIFPFAPFRVIVSPEVGYDATNNVTDIYLVDSRELGYLIVDEEVTTEEFNDPARDIRKIKFRERYSVASPFDARMRLANNVVLARNYDLSDKLVWDAGVTDLPDISFDLGLT